MTRLEELQKQYRDNVAALEDLKKRRDEKTGEFAPDIREAIERNNADYEKIMADFKVEKDLEARTKQDVLNEFHERSATTTTTATATDARKKDYDAVFWRAMSSSQRNAVDYLDEE